MSGIDPAARMAALIRLQATSLRQKAGERPKAPAAKTAYESKPAARRDIAELITKRLEGIDAADPQRERKVFRVFLESVLLAELGKELINDPAFARMVDDVQEQMEGDEEVAPAVRQAARMLIEPPTS